MNLKLSKVRDDLVHESIIVAHAMDLNAVFIYLNTALYRLKTYIFLKSGDISFLLAGCQLRAELFCARGDDACRGSVGLGTVQ